MRPGDDQVRIVELEARVIALEKALARRSQELRIIQEHACSTDLVLIQRVTSGLPPLPQWAYEVQRMADSTALVAVDAPRAIADLWSYLALAQTSERSRG